MMTADQTKSILQYLITQICDKLLKTNRQSQMTCSTDEIELLSNQILLCLFIVRNSAYLLDIQFIKEKMCNSLNSLFNEFFSRVLQPFAGFKKYALK